jgi:hypothetical protein
MSYDLCFRYRRALQPDGLRTIQTALRAANEAANDARLAGIDPETDPATVLLSRHLGRIAAGADPEQTYDEDAFLRRKCLAKIDELKSRPAFIALARRGVSYDPEAKRAFHLDTKRALRAFAQFLGLESQEYDLRSNQAGPAISGEITLHADQLYIQVSIGLMGPGREIMFRRCNSRADYCGHRNGFADIAALADHPKLANIIRRETGLTFKPRLANLV